MAHPRADAVSIGLQLQCLGKLFVVAGGSGVLLGGILGADLPRRLRRDTEGIDPVLRIGLRLPADVVAAETAGSKSLSQIDDADLGDPFLYPAEESRPGLTAVAPSGVTTGTVSVWMTRPL